MYRAMPATGLPTKDKTSATKKQLVKLSQFKKGASGLTLQLTLQLFINNTMKLN